MTSLEGAPTGRLPEPMHGGNEALCPCLYSTPMEGTNLNSKPQAEHVPEHAPPYCRAIAIITRVKQVIGEQVSDYIVLAICQQYMSSIVYCLNENLKCHQFMKLTTFYRMKNSK